MEYVALKPCSLGGRSFRIGETVPGEAIQPGAERNLIGLGIIAAKKGADSTEEKAPEEIEITAHTADGDLGLNITQAGLQSVVDVLTGNADDAKDTIKDMEDAEALILLDILDARKTVRELAKQRAIELTPEEAGE